MYADGKTAAIAITRIAIVCHISQRWFKETATLRRWSQMTPLAMIATGVIWLHLRRVAVSLNQRCDMWQTIAILVIAIAAVLPSAYIYVQQGFFPGIGETFF